METTDVTTDTPRSHGPSIRVGRDGVVVLQTAHATVRLTADQLQCQPASSVDGVRRSWPRAAIKGVRQERAESATGQNLARLLLDLTDGQSVELIRRAARAEVLPMVERLNALLRSDDYLVLARQLASQQVKVVEPPHRQKPEPVRNVVRRRETAGEVHLEIAASEDASFQGAGVAVFGLIAGGFAVAVGAQAYTMIGRPVTFTGVVIILGLTVATLLLLAFSVGMLVRAGRTLRDSGGRSRFVITPTELQYFRRRDTHTPYRAWARADVLDVQVQWAGRQKSAGNLYRLAIDTRDAPTTKLFRGNPEAEVEQICTALREALALPSRKAMAEQWLTTPVADAAPPEEPGVLAYSPKPADAVVVERSADGLRVFIPPLPVAVQLGDRSFRMVVLIAAGAAAILMTPVIRANRRGALDLPSILIPAAILTAVFGGVIVTVIRNARRTSVIEVNAAAGRLIFRTQVWGRTHQQDWAIASIREVLLPTEMQAGLRLRFDDDKIETLLPHLSPQQSTDLAKTLRPALGFAGGGADGA